MWTHSDRGPDLEWVALGNVFWRQRRFIGCLGAIGLTVLLLGYLFWPRTWAVEATLVPIAQASTSWHLGSSATALLRGLGLWGAPSSLEGQEGLFVEAYARLLRHPEVLRAVLRDSASDRRGLRRTVGAHLLVGYQEDREHKVERALQRLRARVRAWRDAQTGLLYVRVEMPDPILSAEVARRLVERFSAFLERLRTRREFENVSFLRARLSEVGRQLRQAEDALAAFVDRHPDAITARYAVERQRLERQVSLRTELYSELQRQLAAAELELARRRPVVVLLDSLRAPVRPAFPQPVPWFATGVGALLLVTVVIAFWWDRKRESKQSAPLVVEEAEERP
ncbi:MAG: hypothetical protein RMK61_01605 [Bacteroidota bacterium]|nr:hypothetical protein [Bacteroidota bacterium]